MRRQLLPAIMMMVVFTVLLGIAYPLVVTGIAQGAFSDQANGSQLEVNGKVVGSKLLGQTFTKAEVLPRPSERGRAAAATGSDAADPNDENKTVPNDPKDLSQDISSGSNWGPTNPDLLAAVKQRVAGVPQGERARERTPKVPVDAVTASASGLDPHISVANARHPGAPGGAASAGCPLAAGQQAHRRQHRRPFARLPRRAGRQRARAQRGARPVDVTVG